MAAREHRVSRRVLLGAACAVPLIRHPGLDPGSSFPSPRQPDSRPPDRRAPRALRGNAEKRGRGDEKPVLGPVEKWRKAVARFRRAEAILDAAIHEPDEDLYGDLVVAFNRALKRLLRTPATDLAALSFKLHLAVDHAAWELTGGEAGMAALKQDARRLAARG